MTIAAAFKYQGGILLCADREISHGASKYAKSKVFGEQISPQVSIAFTYSGGMDFATMAIQESIAVIKSSGLLTHAQISFAVKDKIQEIYSDSIGSLPDYQQPDNHFDLLVAVWAEGSLRLLVTENTAVVEENQYRCVGAGKDLAQYLFKLLYVDGSDHVPLETAEMASLRILEHVKDSVVGCGKDTDVLIMGSDGSLSRKSQDNYRFELRLLESYDGIIGFLFPFAIDFSATDEELDSAFKIALSLHKKILLEIRTQRFAQRVKDNPNWTS